MGSGLAVVPTVGVTPTPSILPGMAVGISIGTGVVAPGWMVLPGLGGFRVDPEGEVAEVEKTGSHCGTRQHESRGSVTRVQPAGTLS